MACDWNASNSNSHFDTAKSSLHLLTLPIIITFTIIAWCSHWALASANNHWACVIHMFTSWPQTILPFFKTTSATNHFILSNYPIALVMSMALKSSNSGKSLLLFAELAQYYFFEQDPPPMLLGPAVSCSFHNSLLPNWIFHTFQLAPDPKSPLPMQLPLPS